ncbi:hypothetical protein E4U41_006159 [Claviceps citrina]|nr:hypothetical protein E4U41_006159 [Claviceps citrina]
MSASTLPLLPVPLAALVRYIAEKPDLCMVEILKPYREYEARLRELYAQDGKNPILNDP